MKLNYYISSFFWSTLAKILNAVIGFVTIPLLLKYFGVNDYGVLSLANAANAYMNLLDLGINIGAIKYFSQWRSEKKYTLIENVARTSISFYGIIGLVNALLLFIVGLFCENLFNISHEEFLILRILFFILACFSIINWISMVFSQLLISDNRISFTQQMLSVRIILKLIIILITIQTGLSLPIYFFLVTLSLAVIILPYYWICKRNHLINSFLPLFHWKDFRIIYRYSMAIFALSFFQMTAANSRPIILGMFAQEAATVVAKYKIIEVFPMFIASVGGMLTSILLPKSSNIIAKNDTKGKDKFAYEGTRLTSILTILLCMPVALCANELLTLYVGEAYSHLAVWLQIWCFTMLINLHTTPCNSLILATGKTKPIVLVTAISCILSIIINILLSSSMGVGSAVIGFFIYVLIIVTFNYAYYYKNTLKLEFAPLVLAFMKPALLGSLCYAIVYFLKLETLIKIDSSEKYILIFRILFKVIVWMAIFVSSLFIFRILNRKHISLFSSVR